MKSIHLVCNAHLDPVWLWEWEEGVAEVLSTFRVAADLCEQYDSFIFNHNEVILYKWVEEYEPELFAHIQDLVRRGKWHIMGGWYLQPDCNMPSGESFVRQALLGREYFEEKFGVRPTTAINFDPFGHSRGLVQILSQSGYDSYLCCRPGPPDCPLPANTLHWEGYDGSRILLTRVTSHYNSGLGQARAKAEGFLAKCPEDACAVLLWGVGNHGGGPSRQDLADLAELIEETKDADLRHSTPEAYFRELADDDAELPVHRGDLNPWAVGCYTSQVRLKQKHRTLENELFATEKMSAAAWSAGLLPYPAAALHETACDLATSQFHDILPGSSIQRVEDYGLRLMDGALERLSRVKTRAFFALASAERPAQEGQIPILVYNPHPFPITGVWECEFQLADQNWEDTFTQVSVFSGRRRLPSQVEKEASNLTLDWRKRVAFEARLEPGQMNRFDCKLEVLPAKPKPELAAKNGKITFRTDDVTVEINTRTGLIDRYAAGGHELLRPGACRPLVMHDNGDPWGMTVRSFNQIAGKFRLLSAARSAQFAGIDAKRLAPVRVIEDGAVRVVVEALFGYGDSFICQRYKLPRRGAEIELETRVVWNEKDRMLKLAIPAADKDAKGVAQVAFGVEEVSADGSEAVGQKWAALLSSDQRTALTCINHGSYGMSLQHGELRLSLLRSPAYAAHPIRERDLLPQDRFSPRIDQGERLFRFWLHGGERGARLSVVDREALARNETPMALPFYPPGRGQRRPPFVKLRGAGVVISAIKKAERDDALIIRLFEPTGVKRTATLMLPMLEMQKKLTLRPFEVRTLKADLAKRTFAEVDLMEQ